MATEKRMIKIYLYSRFERFWHWVQAALIVALLITGFEVHGAYKLLGFQRAAEIHNFLGLSWLVLFAFIVFWLFTTGEWKQYIPTTRKLFDVVQYYCVDIFKGKPHPVQKCKDAKHNPLQRLTYLGLSALLLPLQMATGLLYYTYNSWEAWGIAGFLDLGVLAVIHTALAFLLLTFLVVHVYMTTTGHKVSSHITAMCCGWEEVEEGARIEDWEKSPAR
jgi:thiosulfate reductase cytochrome b subunit